MKNKYFNHIFLWLGILGFGIAQIQNPVSLKLNGILPVRSGEVANVTFTASIDKGWHIYAVHDVPEGPKATNISISGDVIDKTIKEEDKLNTLFDFCKKHKGNTPLIFHMMTSQSRYQKILINKYLVSPSNQILIQIRSMFGNKNVWLS